MTNEPTVEDYRRAAVALAGYGLGGGSVEDTSDPFQAGDRVESEYGQGTVIAYSSRRLAYQLDSGETINVVTGTPGFYRVTRVEN
jgi:hypothetical protein